MYWDQLKVRLKSAARGSFQNIQFGLGHTLGWAPVLPKSKGKGPSNEERLAWASTCPMRLGQTGTAVAAVADPQPTRATCSPKVNSTLASSRPSAPLLPAQGNAPSQAPSHEGPQAPPAGLLANGGGGGGAEEMVVVPALGGGGGSGQGRGGVMALVAPHPWHTAAVPGPSVFSLNHQNR